jgi:hypothetical protein
MVFCEKRILLNVSESVLAKRNIDWSTTTSIRTDHNRHMDIKQCRTLFKKHYKTAGRGKVVLLSITDRSFLKTFKETRRSFHSSLCCTKRSKRRDALAAIVSSSELGAEKHVSENDLADTYAHIQSFY